MRPTTALADAFARAGLNTAELRLRELGLDALRKHHRNIPRAFPTFDDATEDDPDLIAELKLFYLCRLDAELLGAGHAMRDNHVEPSGAQQTSPPPDLIPGFGETIVCRHLRALPNYRDPTAAQANAVSDVKNRVALTILDKCRTSDGRAWGDVGCHELDGMARDGKLAAAVKNHIGVLSNEDQFKTVREMISAAKFAEIKRAAEEAERV